MKKFSKEENIQQWHGREKLKQCSPKSGFEDNVNIDIQTFDRKCFNSFRHCVSLEGCGGGGIRLAINNTTKHHSFVLFCFLRNENIGFIFLKLLSCKTYLVCSYCHSDMFHHKYAV